MRTLDGGRNMQDAARYELDGGPIYFPKNGAFDEARALMVTGDWSQLAWTLRQDVTYKILTEATITESDGAGGQRIVYNLAQQDMVGLRAVMRLAWQVPNPANRFSPDEATRYPFAALTQ